MMMPASRLTCRPASLAHQTAMDKLDNLLQDVGCSVEGILRSYIGSILQPSELEALDLSTFLSMNSVPNICSRRPNVQNYDDSVAARSHKSIQFMPSCNDNVQCSNTENWLFQKQPSAMGPEKASDIIDDLECGDKGGFVNEDALRELLEEIKETVCKWSLRQKSIQRDIYLRRAPRDDVAAGPAVSLPDNTLFAPLERGQNTAMHVHCLQGDMSGEVRIQELQLKNEGEKDAQHRKQNQESNRQEILQQNRIEQKFRSGFLSQQGENAGSLISDMEAESSLYLDNGIDKIGCQQQTLEQPRLASTSLSQAHVQSEPVAHLPAGNGEAQLDSFSADANVACAAENSNHTPLLEAVKPSEKTLLAATNDSQTEASLQITKWTQPTRHAKTHNRRLPLTRVTEIITSPDWLPEGWVTELKTRGSGNSAGSKDKYYVDPVSHRRFRSRKEVIAHLECSKIKLADDISEACRVGARKTKLTNDSPKTSPAKKVSEPQHLPILSNKSNKKAKLKESGTPSCASAVPSSMAPSIGSLGLLSNMLMPPFRSGPPSEWLVYESLASLPFPMFDPFYYKDFSRNKSSSGKATYLPSRPCFFTGSEASWNSFKDRTLLSKPEIKSREFESYFSMSYPSDLGSNPSSGGTKNPS